MKTITNLLRSFHSYNNIFNKIINSSKVTNIPKSLPNLEKIYLENIEKEFDDLDIDIFKENVIK